MRIADRRLRIADWKAGGALVVLSGLLLCNLQSAICNLQSPHYPDRARLLVWRDDQGTEHTVKTAADWAKRRAHILAGLQEAMGPLPGDKDKVPLDITYGAEVKTPKFVRKKLTFAVAKDDRVPAWLLIPIGLTGKAPAVLCLHQTVAIGKDEPAGLGTNENLRYAVHLAERGYVTLAPDYPSFGEYKYDFKKSSFASGSMKAIWNNLRAVDVLASLPQVDADRIGCIGHSLGGHNAMFTAAFDTRIKATVSNCGFTSFPKYYGGKLKGWTSDRYMPRIDTVYKLDPKRVPFDFPEVVAALAPRAFLASSPLHDHNFEVSGVKDCVKAAEPVYALLGARGKLQANYPDCKHEFPPDVRKVAYEFLDRHLKAARAEGAGKLALTVSETAGIRRFGYPVYVKFDLPRAVTAKDRFRLLDGGKPIAAQFRPLGQVGATRAVALDFNLSVAPLEKKALTVEYGPGVAPPAEPRGLTLEEDKGVYTIRSGGLSYVVDPKYRWLRSVRGGKTDYLRLGREVPAAERPVITVVRQGPLAVCLRLTGKKPGGGHIDLTFPRSKSWVEIAVTFDDPKGEVPVYYAEMPLRIDGRALVDFGAGTGVYTALSKGQHADLTADGKGGWKVSTGTDTKRMTPLVVPAPGSKAPAEGWAHVMDGTRATALAVDRFGQGTKDSIQVSATGDVEVWRHFAKGQKGTKSLRVWYHFVPMPVQVGALTSPQSMQAPLAVAVKAAE